MMIRGINNLKNTSCDEGEKKEKSIGIRRVAKIDIEFAIKSRMMENRREEKILILV